MYDVYAVKWSQVQPPDERPDVDPEKIGQAESENGAIEVGEKHFGRDEYKLNAWFDEGWQAFFVQDPTALGLELDAPPGLKRR